jgi:N-acetylmuramoyl-L-alanine amidase
VVTVRIARRSDGGTLAAGLTLPRVGGTDSSPLVMTPCGAQVRLSADDLRRIPPGSGGSLPKRPADVLVVIDPGHGGHADGTLATDGTKEKERVLQISLALREALRAEVGRVVLTRDRDMDATLGFRTALVDALRADAAVSVHLNAEPDGPLPRPGVETYGSVADPLGRRFAGVIYESVRRYLDTLGGPWQGDRDAGAKYRLSSRGGDYYGLLRRSHRPVVIAESLFLSVPREAALVAREDVRRGLAGALARGLLDFTTTGTPGSGWARPYPRGADPPPPPGQRPDDCTDPSR